MRLFINVVQTGSDDRDSVFIYFELDFCLPPSRWWKWDEPLNPWRLSREILSLIDLNGTFPVVPGDSIFHLLLQQPTPTISIYRRRLGPLQSSVVCPAGWPPDPQLPVSYIGAIETAGDDDGSGKLVPILCDSARAFERVTRKWNRIKYSQGYIERSPIVFCLDSISAMAGSNPMPNGRGYGESRSPTVALARQSSMRKSSTGDAGASGSNSGQHQLGTSGRLVDYDALIRHFDCPVCHDWVTPPIVQCRKGHIVCGPCKSKGLKACPVCKQRFSDVPNWMMEQVRSKQILDTSPFPPSCIQNRWLIYLSVWFSLKKPTSGFVWRGEMTLAKGTSLAVLMEHLLLLFFFF